MDFEGENARLTEDEQRITGMPEVLPIAAISAEALYARIHERNALLDQRRAEDDDMLTNSERATILPDALELHKDRDIVNGMMRQFLDHQFSIPAAEPNRDITQ